MAENLDDNYFSQFLPRDESAVPDSDPTATPPVAPDVLKPGEMGSPLDADPTIAGVQAQKHIDQGEELDRARDGSATSIFSQSHPGARGALDDRSFGRLSPEQQKQWITDEKAAAQSQRTRWQGVNDYVLSGLDAINRGFARAAGLPDDPNAPSDPVVAGLRTRVDGNIALAKRREFLADQMEQGLLKPAELTPSMAAFEETMKGFGDTGVANMVAGSGRAAEYATDIISGGIDKPRNDATFYEDIVNDALQVGKKGGGTLQTAGELAPRLYATTLRHVGAWISAKTKELFPGDEARQFEFGTQLANGAGSMIAFMGPSFGAAMLSRASPASLGYLAAYGDLDTTALLAAQKLAETQATRGALATASGLGAPMQGEAMAQDAEDAMRRGVLKADGTPVTDSDVRKAFGFGLIGGATEGLPLEHLMSKFGGSPIMAIASQMLQEGGQEWGQQVIENLTAQNYYDPDRRWDEGAWESAAVGAILGGGMEGGKIGLEKGKEAYNQFKGVREARLRTKGVVNDIEPIAAAPEDGPQPGAPAAPAVAPAVAVEPPKAEPAPAPLKPALAWPAEEGGVRGTQDDELEAMAGMTQGAPESDRHADLSEVENDPEFADFRDLVGEVPTTAETGTPSYVERLSEALDARNTERQPSGTDRGTTATETAEVPDETAAEAEPGTGSEDAGLPEPIHLTSPTPSSVESNIQATRDLAEMARARMSADERMEGLSAKQLGTVYQDVLGSKPPFGSSKVKMRAAIAAGRQGDEKTVHAAIDRATGRGNAQPVSATAGNQTTEGNAKQTPSVAAQGGAETATPEMQDRFRDVLRSDIPSKKWAKALGATPAQMKQLIKAGVRQGLLRKGRGNVVRRTPLAKRGTSSRVATAAPVTEAPALTGKAAVIGSPENMAAREKAARETMTSPEWLGKTLNAGIDTSKAPGYMTPEWKANRQYVAEDGSIIQGFDAMVANETARLLAQHEVAQDRKAFIVIGYPGAGKSTLATPLSEQTRAAEVSPDPIKARIPEYDGGSNAGGVHEESADVSKGVLANMIEGGYNIVLEKLGSTESSVTKPAAALRAAGYHVTLVYVDVPKAVAMERAIGRAKRNGRTIAVSTYDADINGVFGALKNEGVTDESSHFEWKEPGGWQFVDRSPSLQGIHISGVDQPGPREPGVGGRGLDRQDGRGDQSRGGTGEGEAGSGRVDVPANADEAWLSQLLVSHNIDPNLYGKGEAKTLANLLSEITGGESTLYVEDGKLVRRLQTLGIDVTYRDPATGQLYHLREDRQEFRDGRVRRRNLFASLGEKLKAGEEPATSIGRALEEELGVIGFEQKGGIRSRDTKSVSQSYPGLTTENTIHDAEVVLPQSEFRPEYQEVQKEKTNYFVWQAVNEAGDPVISDVPRADRLIRQREAEGAAPFPDFLYDYATRLDSARGDNVAFAPVMAEVRADKRITKAMALELAHIVGVQPTKGTSKAAALTSIEARHADLAKTKEALDAERRALGEGEGSVSEEGVPGRGETLGENGLPEGSPEGDRAGSGSDVRSGVGADAGSAGHAGELPGSAPAASGDTGTGARNGNARSNRDAARERAKVIRQSIKADRDAEREARADRARANYEITPADKIGQGGAKTKIKGNIEALQLAAKIEAENRQATEDEKAVLVKYVGWGAFAQDMFSEHKPEFAKERAILKDLLTPSEYKAARASVTNAHYTSEDVINGVWKALDHLGFKGGRALEPSAGIGHFIGLMPNHLKASTDWSAVELDTVSGRILKALYGATDVRVQGFETAEWPDGFFDLAISNVPFAETGPYDPRYKQKMTLHDYFFRKALDKVRPGGIVAFITSSGTLDKVNSGPRRELAKHGTFLGAIRLPGGSKGAFKSNAGTDVTTDVIFMRRRVEGEPVADNTWLGLTEIKTPEGPTAINAYFAQHPEMMLGKMRLTGSMYRADQPVLIGSSEELGDKIAEAAKAGLPENAMLDRGVTPADIAPDVDTSPLGKPGAYYQKDKKTYRVLNGVGVEQKLSTADAQKIQQFVGLRDTINALLAGQQQEGFDGTALRADLNKAYDSFVKDHGPINKVVTTVTNRLDKAGNSITIRKYPNMSAFEDDPDAYKVAAIEVYNEKTGDTKKAAIFNEDILAAYERPEIQSSSDALAVSLNEFGRIDMPFIAEQLGVPLNEAIAQLGDKVYLDPKGDNWLAAEQYLAGDVVEKLEQAKAAAKADEKYARNVAALEKAQPEPLTRADIRINMGAPWLPLDVYQEFIYDEFGVRNAPIIYNEAVQKWSLAQKIFFPPSAQTKWGTGKTAPGDVLEAALNSTRINITFEDAAGNRIHDVKAEEEANARVQALRDIFNGAPARGIESWVWSSDSRAERLEPLYNYQFNRLAPEKYDGSHLTFPGLARVVTYSDGSTGTINLTPHRVNAVWRIIRNGNSLLGHVVGAGKTFTMIMSGMEQKRLGLIQRPMYVVPNHMLEQFSNEFLQAYPNAKLLVASKDEMSLKKRKEFIARAAADKWDGIIITHDAFGRVRMSDAAYKEFYEQQIEELRDVIEQQKGEHGGRSPTVKQTEKRMKSLEAKLKKLLKVEHKDEGTTFEEMSVDFLYVDEAHLFKNLSFATQHARVKGISNSSESQRATDLFVKIRHLEKSRPGRSNVFASGTPVSNTMAELYTMQRYQQLDELKKYGIDQFDAWAHTFGQMHSEIERKVDGSMRAVESFSRFINIPELMAIWSRVADMQTADMLNLPRPKLQDGKIGVVEAQANEAEVQYMQSLVERAERMKREKVDPSEDNMLKIVSEGRKVATDMRLLDKAAPFNENGKVAKAVDKIFDIWQKGADPALGQMVFLDMGVPGSKGGAKPTPVKGGGKGGVELPDAIKRIQDAFRDEAAADGDVSTDDVEAEANQESDDFFAGLFNLYEDIRDRLIAKGIPKEQIAFIHEAKGDEGKERMFEAVREGKIRVFMGSTGKMGVGTNVQKRLIAMHHIDAPWKPAEVEQRDGRILRQGNRNPEIQIYRYVTKNSFDAYMWQILERKAKFIGQLLSGARGVRDMEDIDNPLPEASALKAAASGDPRILEHATLSKEITELEMAKRAQLRAAQSAKSTIASTQNQIETATKHLLDYTVDADKVQDLSGDNFKVTLSTSREPKAYDKRVEAGEAVRDYILRAMDQIYYGGKREFSLGQMSGFEMNAEVKRTEDGLDVRPVLSGTTDYRGGSFLMSKDSNPSVIMQRFERVMRDVPGLKAATEIALQKAKTDLPRLEKAAAQTTFAKQDILDKAQARLTTIENAINAPAEQAAAPAAQGERAIAEGKISPAAFARNVAALKERMGVETIPLEDEEEGGITQAGALLSIAGEVRRSLEGITRGSRIAAVRQTLGRLATDTQDIVQSAAQIDTVDIDGAAQDELRTFRRALNDLVQILNKKIDAGYKVRDAVEGIGAKIENSLDDIAEGFEDINANLSDIEDSLNDIVDGITEAYPDLLEREGSTALSPLERPQDLVYPENSTMLDALSDDLEHARKNAKATEARVLSEVGDVDVEALSESEARALYDRIEKIFDAVTWQLAHNSADATHSRNTISAATEQVTALIDEMVQPAINELEEAADRVADKLDEVSDLLDDEGGGIDTAASLVAYHGSRHSFDRFSASQIGNGAGVQAYGYGLYFASNPDVAAPYRTIGSNQEDKQKGGNIYQVSLDVDPEKIVNLDKPFKAQSAFVQAALKPQLESYDVPIYPSIDGMYAAYIPGYGSIGPNRFRFFLKREIASHFKDEVNRRAFMRAKLNDSVDEWVDFKTKSGAQALAKLGIEGVMYSDGHFKSGANLSGYNYVVFDDDKINITHKNGKPLSADDRVMQMASLFSEGVESDNQASVPPPLTLRAQRMAPEIAAAIEDELRRALPRDVAGRVADQLFIDGNPATGLTDFQRRLVEVSLLYGEGVARETSRHEIVHALRGNPGQRVMRSLYTPSEWATLVERATKTLAGRDMRASGQASLFAYRDIYGNMTKNEAYIREALDQERVARMAETWVDGASYGTTIDKLLYRLKEFADAIARALRSLGFNTPADVFGTDSDAILRQSFSGEIANREDVGAEPDALTMLRDFKTATVRNLIPEPIRQRIAAAPTYGKYLEALQAGRTEQAAGFLKMAQDYARGNGRLYGNGRATVRHPISPDIMASLIGERGAENMAKSNPAAKEALRMAQEMDAAHATEDQIWTATANYLAAHDKTGDLIGVYMGVDGQWRIEVDDSKVNPTLHAEGSNVGTVPEMLPHPTLEAAHPDLENASSVLNLNSKRYRPPTGHATGDNFMRVTGSTPEDIASVGMHEYQHLLQAREGFARGTSPAEAGKRHLPDLEKANTAQALIDMVANAALQSKTPIIKTIDDAVRALDGKYGRIKITPEMIALAKDPGMLAHFVESIPSSHEAYRRSAGETEARMVQKRLDMTAEERRERPPYDDYDVADYMQVVHGENGAALSAEPEDIASKLEGTAANKVRTPTKSQSVESLSRIIEDLKAALGMTATQGRYGLSVTDQSTGVQNNRPPKTWRFKPQKSLRGQYHGRVGAARYKLSTDIEAIAHEGGHHLEHILGQPLLDLKRNHADELRSYAYRSFAPAAPNGSAPQLQPIGFSGLDLDADVQRLLIESVAADDQALSTNTPEAKAKNQRLRAELEYRLGQNAADTVFNDAYVHAQQARSLADLPQYVQQRFSETGTAQPAANDQRASISEGFAEFFREYITNPDQARKFAPEFYADFEDLLDANAPQLLQSIERAQLVTTSKAYDDYLRATTLDRARADLVSEADQSWFTRALDSKILRGIGQEGTISGAVYRVFSDAMGSLHGAANQAYRMFIDEAHPFYIGTKRLLEQADQNHITDGQGRAVSLAIHQNPYKLMRSIGDSFKTGLRWIQDGVPNYRETGGVRSASLHDALAMVMGKDWNLESYQDFGVYLESRRAVEEWQAWNTKRQTLANLGGKIDVARAQNRVLRDHLAKARAKAERRDRANTANDAVMREYDRALQGLTTEEARLVRELQEGQVATPGMTPQQERNVRMRLADTRQKINTYESRRTEFAARRNAVNTDRQSLDVHIGRFESAIAKREAIIDRSRQHLDHLRSGGLQRAPHRIGMMEHQARLAGLEKMYPSLPQAANMVYDFVWQSAVHDFQAGRLTKEELDYRATRRHFYVPFARDLSDMIEERGVGGRKTVEKFAKDKTFEGSDRAIRNPIETIIDQTFHRAAATHFNDVMKAFTNLADAVGVGGAAVAERVDQGQTLAADQNGFRQLENRLVSLGYAPDDAREMVKRIESDFGDTQLLLQWSPEGYGPNRPLLLPLWENGERKLIRLNDPEWAGLVYNSVNGMGREMSNLLIDVLAKPASLLRWSVTTNPAFVIPNIIRDMASAWILTGNLLDPRTWPIVTQMRGIYHEMAQTDMARLYQEVAGLMGGQNVAALSKVRDKADVMALEARGLHLRPLRLGFATAIGAAAGFATLGPSGAGFGALVGAGLHNGASRFFETLSHFSDLSETATRMGTFTQAYRAALSYNPTLTPYQAAQEAAYVARDLIDFGRRGSNMLVAARLVPFLNANVQGLDKAVRTLLARSDRGFSLSGAKLLSAGALGGAAGYIAAGATLGATGAFVVPAAAVALAKRSEVARRLLAPAAKRIAALPLSQDEERILGDSAKAWFNLLCYTGLLVAMGAVSGGGDPDEYKMISDRVKNRSQPVKLGGSWYQIPKAFEFSVPANIISAGIATQFDKDPRFWERVRGSIAENIAPPGLPQTAKLWSDIRGNYNSMTGGQIVPEWQQKLPPQDQFNAYTSEMAIALARSVNANPGLKATAETIGQTLFATPNFEVSPAIIDYVLSTGGGYWGKDIQKVSNQVAGVPTGPNSGRLTEFPIIGTVLQRVSIDPYRANDALEAYYNTMQPTGKAFDRAATGYDFVLTNQGQGPANALLATMDDDHRAYALLMATNDVSAKRSHPLNRLKDVLGSVRSVEQDLALGRLADTSSKMDPQPITLAPAKAAEVRDTLAKIKALEAWNTMVDMGADQFANRQLIDIKPTMSLLEAQSPETADELQRRYDRKKIQELEVSNDVWQETKADLLTTWAELSPTNEAMPNPKTRRTPKPLPMMRLGGPVPPLGAAPDEEMMGAGYPSQAADVTKPLDEGIVQPPAPADTNMRAIRPDMPNNLGPEMQPNPASPNNMDEMRWQQKLM